MCLFESQDHHLKVSATLARRLDIPVFISLLSVRTQGLMFLIHYCPDDENNDAQIMLSVHLPVTYRDSSACRGNSWVVDCNLSFPSIQRSNEYKLVNSWELFEIKIHKGLKKVLLICIRKLKYKYSNYLFLIIALSSRLLTFSNYNQKGKCCVHMFYS